MTRKNSKVKKISTTVSFELLAIVDSTAKNIGMDRSALLRRALLEKLAKMGKLPEAQAEDLSLQTVVIFMQQEEEAELIEGLRNSKTAFGVINKVKLAKDGTVIDGKHRLEADPNWETETLNYVDTIGKKAIATLLANLQRRTVDAEEIGLYLGIIAQETKLSLESWL